MWINIDTIRETMVRAAGTRAPDPSIYEQAHQKREIEKAILEKGAGVCMYCDEEIRYNRDMAPAGWPWESEYMVGWCDNVRGNKHSPRIEIAE